MTKNELKQIAKMALETEYGFGPKISDITLLEADGTGLYILFSVKGNEYRFESRYFPIGRGSDRVNTVWCGKGTIKRVEEGGN